MKNDAVIFTCSTDVSYLVLFFVKFYFFFFIISESAQSWKNMI